MPKRKPMEQSNTPREPHEASSRTQRLLVLLHEISQAVDQAETAKIAFSEVLSRTCVFMGWPLAHAYIWSDAAGALISSPIWYMEDPDRYAEFRELSDSLQFKQGEGLLGQILEDGQPLTIANVRRDPRFVRSLPLEEARLRGYFAFPVTKDGEITAVLEFFSPETGPTHHDISAIITYISALLGMAIKRQQTLNRLRQSEAQLAEAQRTAHVGHWEWHLATDRVNWSPELYRIYGCTPQQFKETYDSFMELVHPDEREYVAEKVKQAVENGRPFDYFHRIVRPNGDERVVHARGRPIYDAAGKIVKLYGTTQDMTEQKVTELQLARTVRRLSVLLEVGQSISSTLDINAIYARVFKLVRPLLGAEALILFIHSDGSFEAVAVDQDNFSSMHGVKVKEGEGIVSTVWRDGKPRLLQEDECRQQLSPTLLARTGYQPATMLAVPVSWQDQSIGVLEAVHRNPNAFTQDDLQLLETVAAWTAIAIGNAYQYGKLQRRLNESDAMATISKALAETLELNALLQLIVTQGHDIVSEAEWVVIHLLNSSSKQLEVAASAGLNLRSETYRINLGEGIAGRVMAEGIVLNVPDVQNDPRHLPIDASENMRSLLVAPVENRHRRIGTISVQCSTPAAFNHEDERLLTILGLQAGIAIENARLYTAQQHARKIAEKQRERMQLLARHVVEAQEVERERIARELHDESGQALTSLKISLEMIRMQLPDEWAEIKKSLQDVVALTDKTMNNLRLLSHNLRPPGLDAYGLHAALEGLCQDFEMHTHLQVQYTGLDLPELAPLPALSLYRFTQEALTNAAKHAEATTVQVTLDRDGKMVRLTVADDGRGFVLPNLDEVVPSDGAGLLGIVERLEMVDGRLEVDATPGEGSRFTAVIPLNRTES